MKIYWFSSGVPREQALLRKSKTARNRQKIAREKWTFLSLAFDNAPSLHTLWFVWLSREHFRDMSVWRWFEPCFQGILAYDPPDVVKMAAK